MNRTVTFIVSTAYLLFVVKLTAYLLGNPLPEVGLEGVTFASVYVAAHFWMESFIK